jgi:hypothetical protein
MHPRLVPIPSKPVQCVTKSESGDDLAPEQSVCEVPDDCVQCAEKATCKDYKPLTSKTQPIPCASTGAVIRFL